MHLLDSLRRAAAACPNRCALRWHERVGLVAAEEAGLPATMSYSELLACSEAVAVSLKRELLACGEAPTDPEVGRPLLAIAVDEGPLLVLAIAASWLAGAAVVPLDVSEPSARIRMFLDDAAPRLVLADAAQHRCLGSAWGAAAATRAAATPALVDLSAMARAAWVLVTQPGAQGTAAAAEEVHVEGRLGAQQVDESGDVVAHVWYTSGSSGTPKGCVVTHRALAAYALARNAAHGLPTRLDVTGTADTGGEGGADAVPVVLMASAHTFDPCVGDVGSAWVGGAVLALCPKRALPLVLGQCLRDTGASHVCTTPSVFASVTAEVGGSRSVSVFAESAMPFCCLPP